MSKFCNLFFYKLVPGFWFLVLAHFFCFSETTAGMVSYAWILRYSSLFIPTAFCASMVTGELLSLFSLALLGFLPSPVDIIASKDDRSVFQRLFSWMVPYGKARRLSAKEREQIGRNLSSVGARWGEPGALFGQCHAMAMADPQIDGSRIASFQESSGFCRNMALAFLIVAAGTIDARASAYLFLAGACFLQRAYVYNTHFVREVFNAISNAKR